MILVDHNEKSQAVNGIEEAEVQEIIDHHRLGGLETIGPVYFRNQPVGCTATIIYQMYQESGVEVEPQMAGLLCSAIISDTLLFRSPTCTMVDQAAAEALARIAGIDMEEHAKEMFNAGSNLRGKSVEEIVRKDAARKAKEAEKREKQRKIEEELEEEEIAELELRVGDIENDFVEGQNEDNNWTAETKIIHCDNCGADNVLNAGEMSVICPFCGSNHTIMTNQVTGIKPHRIIPFQIPSQNVKDAYRKWLRKKIFVPRKVKKQIPNIKLNGVYLPIWTFDSNASSSYDGKLGKYYTRTVGSGKNRRTVTEIRYFCISGNKSLFLAKNFLVKKIKSKFAI